MEVRAGRRGDGGEEGHWMWVGRSMCANGTREVNVLKLKGSGMETSCIATS